jgi:Lipocalin-like domain
MKLAVFAGTLFFAVPLAGLAAEKDLHGTWKMVSQSQKVLDTGEVRAGRGKAPRGYVTFGPDGRMMSVIVNENRPKPESVAKMTDQQRIELFKTMNAYAGTYKVEGNKLTYNFELTHNEVPARASVREIKIEGRRLTMVNEPAPATADGKMVQTTTVWEKVAKK